MAVNYLRVLTSQTTCIARRQFGTSVACSGAATAAPEHSLRDRVHPRIGNRDIVGYGKNGEASYIESVVNPYPAIRFGANTAQTDALMQKAKGDWKLLSLEEKKALYRHSFCQTFAEIEAPDTDWKAILATVLTFLGVAGWVVIFLKNNVYINMQPRTMTKEWHLAQRQRMIDQEVGIVDGLSSKWDYENKTWKK